jgi:hypothetical protein
VRRFLLRACFLVGREPRRNPQRDAAIGHWLNFDSKKPKRATMPRSIVRIGRLITARAYSSLFYSIALGLSVSIGPLETHATEQIRQALSVTPAPAPELTRLTIL